MQVEQVQQWVQSALLITVGTIFGAGVALLTTITDRPGATPGLLVISAVVGILTMAGALLIHRRKPVSPWLILGVLPMLLGWWITMYL